ncbi:cysteinyl-tRNA ligase [endosymbiont of Acanthamoeba sp. UWC8]|uniref:cysteine--tRNA ligase n=1 Tax=endosymbiont of Acanthamoeba sp. UWC8 TaxID=86106 RepID=UPI0004D0C163|nr:cysteine--tRNA ligase [endosymbiont of Acanthamoeba sp. UWC8]AIF81965.1 cysteinyl-tRNA ligase [endosymbiont of Acanthamoeba sp. UWC8]
MSIFLTNTLTKAKEEFIPIDPLHIKMYVCGPTVYDRPHLGNARSAVVFDTLYRLLKKVYPKVTFVRNITDVDDKIITASELNKEDISSLTTRITDYYHEDIAAISCLPPTIEPRATAHIQEMIEMIESLIKQGFAYPVEGHVLFNIESFEGYGKLSRRSVEEMIAGARVEVAPFKKHPADFVLWKPAKENEYHASFESPWGRGRPGWHIECSAMSKKHLGNTFDIHGGGIDLTFPHHENEIAQSVCANNSAEFARYWVHNGFLTVDGEKMSKSLNNFKTVREALSEGIEGTVLRYFYLTTHYRKPQDFTQKAIDDAKKAIERFRNVLSKFNKEDLASTANLEVIEDLKDDLNTPAALARLHGYADQFFKGNETMALHLYRNAEFLGLNLLKDIETIPAEIIKLANNRMQAKAEKNWQLADSLRGEIESKGYTIKDTKGTFEISKL